MRPRTIFLLLGLALLLVAGIGTGLVLLIYHEPGYYRRAAVPPGRERKELSRIAMAKFGSLANFIQNGQDEWGLEITQEHLNSYFEEDFLTWGESEDMRKKGITEPRIVFEPNKVRLGFRYGTGLWSTIISLDLRVWLAPKEINVVAIEILGRHAGALPFSAQALLDMISEQARNNNLEVTWYRHNNNPVALVRFQTDKTRPSFQIRNITLTHGKLTLVARSADSSTQARLFPVPVQEADPLDEMKIGWPRGGSIHQKIPAIQQRPHQILGRL